MTSASKQLSYISGAALALICLTAPAAMADTVDVDLTGSQIYLSKMKVDRDLAVFKVEGMEGLKDAMAGADDFTITFGTETDPSAFTYTSPHEPIPLIMSGCYNEFFRC